MKNNRISSLPRQTNTQDKELQNFARKFKLSHDIILQLWAYFIAGNTTNFAEEFNKLKLKQQRALLKLLITHKNKNSVFDPYLTQENEKFVKLSLAYKIGATVGFLSKAFEASGVKQFPKELGIAIAHLLDVKIGRLLAQTCKRSKEKAMQFVEEEPKKLKK